MTTKPENVVHGYDAQFWYESYVSLRDAVLEHLEQFVRDDDVAEEAIFIKAIELAGKALSVSDAERKDESGWLIEWYRYSTGDPKQPEWWTGHPFGGSAGFSTDSTKAVRFARQIDAERFIPLIAKAAASNIDLDLKATEHIWFHRQDVSVVEATPAEDILTQFEERLRAKFTPSLNTGTAMDALVLVGEVLRDMRPPAPPLPTTETEK
jgi:hypothetical protein